MAYLSLATLRTSEQDAKGRWFQLSRRTVPSPGELEASFRDNQRPPSALCTPWFQSYWVRDFRFLKLPKNDPRERETEVSVYVWLLIQLHLGIGCIFHKSRSRACLRDSVPMVSSSGDKKECSKVNMYSGCSVGSRWQLVVVSVAFKTTGERSQLGLLDRIWGPQLNTNFRSFLAYVPCRFEDEDMFVLKA